MNKNLFSYDASLALHIGPNYIRGHHHFSTTPQHIRIVSFDDDIPRSWPSLPEVSAQSCKRETSLNICYDSIFDFLLADLSPNFSARFR